MKKDNLNSTIFLILTLFLFDSAFISHRDIPPEGVPSQVNRSKNLDEKQRKTQKSSTLE